MQNDSSLSLVALDENQVVGFIISEIMTKSFGADQSGLIKIIGVQPKHMGTGIGQSLIIQLFKQFKKYATDSGNLEGEKNEVRRDRV